MLHKYKVLFLEYGILALFTSILFSRAGMSLLPFILLLYCLYINYKDGWEKEYKLNLYEKSCILYFCIVLISLCWSVNFDHGINMIKKVSMFLFIPLIFLLIRRYDKLINVRKILKKFNYITIVYCTILIINSLTYIYVHNLNIESFFTEIVRLKLQTISFFPLHHVYLGVIINLMIFTSFKVVKDPFIRILFFIIYTLTLYINSSISSFIGYIIVLLMIIYFQKNKRKYILTFGLISLIFSVILYFKLDKISFDGESPMHRMKKLYHKGDPVRILTWKSAISVFEKNKIFGVGVGDEIDEMLKYRERNSYMYRYKLNSHNQFLGVLVRNGITGMVIFVIMFFFLLKITHFHNSFNFVLFFVVFSVLFTENFLDRQRGIIIFLLFSNLFLLINKKNELV